MVSADMSAYSGFPKTGDSDVSPQNQPSQFLLFRSLETGVTEELLAKAVSKLYRQTSSPPTGVSQPANKPKITSTSSTTNLGAKEGSLKRVLLVRDRTTNDSWKYGFAEFASVDDASAALAKYNATDKFTISSKPVMISYIHTGVFVPAPHSLSPEMEQFTFSPLSNPSLKLIYWDQAAYVHEFMVAKKESNLDKIKKRVQEAAAKANKGASEGLLGAPKELAEKKRKAEKEMPSSNKKTVAPHLQFWTNRHAEIHGLPPAEKAPERVFGDGKDAGQALNAPADDEPPSRSFSDMNRKCCLLCARQFKTDAEVHKHERLSQLHRDNLLKDDLVEKALAKMAKAGIDMGGVDSAYRDRAKERRQAFGQPKQPANPNKAKNTRNACPPPEEALKPVQSKGAALLGKMGWTAGQGLGADGSGRTEAIRTDLYASGVGLGAEGGKVGDAVEEANRSTGSTYADFVAKAKDKAKERFEAMQ